MAAILPRPAQTSSVRYWRRSNLLCTPDQARVLDAVSRRERLSMAEIFDLVFERYLDTHAGLPWPISRGRNPWPAVRPRPEHKARHHAGWIVYGVLLSPAQRVVIKQLVARLRAPERGAFSGLVEAAFTECFAALFGEPWPHCPNRFWRPPERWPAPDGPA